MGTVHQRDGFRNARSVLAVGDGVLAVGHLRNALRPARSVPRKRLAANLHCPGNCGLLRHRRRLVLLRGLQGVYIHGDHVLRDVPGGVGSAAGEGAAAEAGPGGDVQGVPGGDVVGSGEGHVPIDCPHAIFKNDAAVTLDVDGVGKLGVYNNNTAVDCGAAHHY